MSETSFFRHCNAPLEKSFTVVYWDQRGAGKSFDRDIPPSTMTVERFISDLQRFDGQLSVRGLWNMGRLVLGGPESSIVDVPNLLRGFLFSQKTLWPEASRLNLLKIAPALQMPVFFFLGRRDHWVPPETSASYFEVLVAPLKKLVWFEESGHEPFVDEPTKFNAAMVDMVRAAAVAPQ